jgi:hypothetical protein
MAAVAAPSSLSPNLRRRINDGLHNTILCCACDMELNVVAVRLPYPVNLLSGAR